MDKSHDEQSLDKLFEGLPVDETNAATTARCLVELAYFETRCRRQNLKHLRPIALSKAQQCVAPHAAEIPPHLKKPIEDELSRFGQKIMNAKHTPFKYWHQEDGITHADCPFTILCKETKRRMFCFFAEPLKTQIKWARQSGMVDAKRQETYYDILRTLARHCESLVLLTEQAELESLKVSIASAQSKCNAIKEQLQQLAPSEDGSGLENKLKKAQAEAAQLSSQLQKRLQCRKT